MGFIKTHQILIPAIFYFIIWIILAINPFYRPQWMLENYLVFAIWITLVYSYTKYKLSNLSYTLILIFLIFHAFGAHYGYSDVPLGYWASKYFGFERPNIYDRIVHFLFGFLFTIPLRELLKKFTNFSHFWIFILPIEFILSYSAFYELIEAVTAWTLPEKDYDPFVGLQGDIWDGYRDMLLAFSGSMLVTIIEYIFIKFRKKTPI